MHHYSKKIGLALATLMACAAAHAQINPKDLSVQGTIRAPSCVVTTSEGDAVYDYGLLSSSLVKPGTGETPLDAKTKNWVISCDGTTYVTFTAVDNRDGSASQENFQLFGLGHVRADNTGKLGYYRVRLTDAKVDGVAARPFHAMSNLIISPEDVATLAKDPSYRFGWADNNRQMIAGRQFEMAFRVEPVLAGSEAMGGPLVEAVNLDGMATINFAFGL
jgi:hypothetical protein